jgi:hypothetical protein
MVMGITSEADCKAYCYTKGYGVAMYFPEVITAAGASSKGAGNYAEEGSVNFKRVTNITISNTGRHMSLAVLGSTANLDRRAATNLQNLLVGAPKPSPTYLLPRRQCTKLRAGRMHGYSCFGEADIIMGHHTCGHAPV